MPNSLKTRLALVAAGIIALLALLLGWRWLTWAPEDWLQERLQSAGVAHWPEPTLISGWFKPRLHWRTVSLEHPAGEFTADKASLTLSPLSILIGKPQITQLSLHVPLWLSEEPSHREHILAVVRLMDALAPHSVTLTQATVVIAGMEWLDIEAAGERLGGSNRFHWQATGRLEQDAVGGSWTAGSVVQQHAEGIRLTEPNWKLDLNRGYWQGNWSGKMRVALIAKDRVDIEHLSWTNRWQPDIARFANGLEWAGAIEGLQRTPEGWRLTGLDTALAFREPDGSTRRLGAISENLGLRNSRAEGQLSLSYQGRNNNNKGWTDRTLAIEGLAEITPEHLNWKGVELLLGLTSDNEQISYFIEAERLAIATEQAQWQLVDGFWQVRTDDAPNLSFGFGKLAGTWPELDLTEAPPVASELGGHLRILGKQLE